MNRRSMTLLVAGILVAVLVTVGFTMPVPYVTFAPGPVTNALGQVQGQVQGQAQTQAQKPLIQIDGHRTYPDRGALDILTVFVQGGPGQQPTLFQALRGWLDGKLAVLPQQLVFPPGATTAEVQKQDSAEMQQSQENAVTAALCHLHLPVKSTDKIVSVSKGVPAAGVLRPGDVVVAAEGQPLGCRSLQDVVTAHKPGESVPLTIERGGQRKQVTVGTTSADGRTVIGVAVNPSYDYPFHVNIGLQDVGGPSAGMIFALGVVDKLTPGSLTGGRKVAGTGTITADGQIGPIGGVQQKEYAAAAAGASVMVVAAGDCDSARAVKPKGLTLIKAKTLDQVIQSLHDLDAGKPVPQC